MVEGPAYMRFADALCSEHQERITRTGFWVPELPLGNGLDVSACQACIARVNKQVAVSGPGLEIRGGMGQWLPSDQAREYAAVHEAGHAVVGVTLGMKPLQASLSGEGGQVDWDTESLGRLDSAVDRHNYAALMVAGAVASKQWLAHQGLDTPANRLDAAQSGFSDLLTLQTALGEFADVPKLIAVASPAVDQLLADSWPQVMAIAKQLQDRTHLSGEELNALMDAPPRERNEAQSAGQQAPTKAAATSKSTRSTKTAPTTSIGGTGMSLIDQARTTLAGTQERGNYILGALRQAQLDLETNATEVAGVSTEAQTPMEIAGIYRQALEQIDQVMGLVSQAATSTEAYAVSLQG
ncbi:hypothetical protein [Saccharopolyspora mangrovi]|uniref:Peptidase M41 domain-containing protein n=1 Tax=Saccharopolyspora mangrovi TaxID=3082379 RepID=A0ABU6A922_9PSEU|nr:hypothetical protein [Saccharopolyspora sp. S2-29]MEB3368067.1 hypothetical protein [Saccharopolyspora sp. S2-29]